jgi:1,4-alpha-glucan branching enzyme
MLVTQTRTVEGQPRQASASLLTDFDLHLFNEGTHTRLYQKLGAHIVELEGTQGTVFAVWAPKGVGGRRLQCLAARRQPTG